MAQDSDDLSLGPWPKGTDMRSLQGEPEAGTLRDTLNWAITLKGSLVTRPGRTRLDANRWHSGFSYKGRSYAVRNGELCRLTKTGSTLNATVIVTGLSVRPLYYVGVGEDVYWSDGQLHGMIRNDVNYRWGPLTPPLPSLSASATGALYAGDYLVALTYLDALGRESGASQPQKLTVTDGQGISVALAAAPAGISYVRAYLSGPNGTELYQHATTSAAASSLLLSNFSENGQPLTTWPLTVMPPATHLCLFNGSIYGAIGDRFVWTEPMHLHLTDYGSRHRANGPITLLAAVNAGILMGTKEEVRFLSGRNRGEFENDVLLQHGAPPQRPLYHTDTNGVIWLSHEGWCYTGPDGSTRVLTQERVVMDEGIAKAALAFNQTNGMKQVITTMQAGMRNNLAAKDYYTAEVIRAGS